MEFTASSKAAAATAAGILIVGFAVIIRSASNDDVAGSIGGACLVMAGLTAVILVLVRHWIRNTAEERRILGAAQREAQAERSRYFAAQAALENEMGRLNRDMAAERHRIATTLVAERAQMNREFKERHAVSVAEAFRTGVEMERAGMLKPDQPVVPANLIEFPRQHPDRQEERARSREHGVVGP